LNRTCRPAGAFCDWRVIYYKYAAPTELAPRRFRVPRKNLNSMAVGRGAPRPSLSERARVNLTPPLVEPPFGDQSARARILLPRPVRRGRIPRKFSPFEPLSRVGMARFAVRAGCSGATIPPAVSRAGTSQRDVPTMFKLKDGSHIRLVLPMHSLVLRNSENQNP